MLSVRLSLAKTAAIQAFRLFRKPSLRRADPDDPVGEFSRVPARQPVDGVPFRHGVTSLSCHPIFLAGDDAEAKATVSRLIEEIGFAPMDTGSLAEGGRRQQPGSEISNQPMTATDAQKILSAGVPRG
jgi:hypothetical protein